MPCDSGQQHATPTGPLFVSLLVILGSIVAGYFAPRFIIRASAQTPAPALSPDQQPPLNPSYEIALPPCCGAPPDWLIHDPRILDRPDAGAVILVRVVEAEVQEDLASVPYAKMLVLKSWQGPFSAGEVLRTPKLYYLCDGRLEDCGQYDFKVGDRGKEFLIMSRSGSRNGQKNPEGPDVIKVHLYWAWPAEKSQALMAALDQAVVDSMPTDKAGYAARLQNELAALEDVRTKLQAAQSNHAPDDEIVDLSTQLQGHGENARRFQIARDYLDKHPKKSGESTDRLVAEALPALSPLPPTGKGTAPTTTQRAPH